MDYKKGDSVKCIKSDYGLILNNIYTIKRFEKGLYGADGIKLEEYGENYFNVNRFVPYDYRKEKIEKLKYLCLKKVIV